MDPGALSRRSALQLGGTAALGPLAGCSALGLGGSRGLSLGDMVIIHESPGSHRVRVELERNDELVLEEMFEFSTGTRKEVVQATWPREPAVYQLYMAVEGPLRTTEDPFDLFAKQFTIEDKPPGDHNCGVIMIHIGDPPVDYGVGIGIGEPGPRGFGNCADDSPSSGQ